MGCLQVSTGGETGPLLSVFLNGNESTYYFVVEGVGDCCRRWANVIVRFFPQLSKVCLSVALSDIVVHPLPQWLKKSVCEQKMWTTWPPVRIQPRLHEAHLGMDVGAVLSWSLQGCQGEKCVPGGPVIVRGKVNYWPRIFCIRFFHWHFLNSIQENPELELQVKINSRW